MVNSNELLIKASMEHYAVPQFNTTNLEWTKYILEECENLKSPVIIGVSEGAIKHMGGYDVIYSITSSLVKDLNITIPVVLHLDHGSCIESCIKAIDAGFTSVMIDASKYPLEENIKIVKEVTEYAKKHNVSVEAEVGSIGGIEDGVSANIKYARLEDCIELVEKTNIDSLAPALGTVHGFYKGKLNINFDRMKEIKMRLNMPLVMHGGTGVPEDLVIRSIQNGISKVNIDTELKDAWNKAVRFFIPNNPDVYDPRKIISSGESAIKEVIKNKITLFGSNDKL